MTVPRGTIIHFYTEMEKKLYSVNDVCGLTGVTRKTLYYYDKIGLLKPAKRKGVQKHKLYDSEQMNRLYEILYYRKAGLNIAEITILIDDFQVERSKILENAMRRLNTELSEKKEQIEALKDILAKEED